MPKDAADKEMERIKELVEAAYENPGLEFDSLRKIGNLVGAPWRVYGPAANLAADKAATDYAAKIVEGSEDASET